MKAIIELDVPEWQIGQEVSVYFPDTMMKHGKCELLKEQGTINGDCEMIIKTAIKQEEDLDLLCNSLNAQAGRFSYSDPALCNCLLRAQAAINSLLTTVTS